MGINTLSFQDFLRSPAAFVYYFYVFFVNSTLALLLEVSRLLGRGNFYKLVTGKFYSPKEEYRIFMFVDLNSSTTIAEKLANSLDQDQDKLSHEYLSDREFEVLKLLAGGQAVSDIASRLSLSVTTISTYRSRIMTKMNLRTNAELTLYAIEHKLI